MGQFHDLRETIVGRYGIFTEQISKQKFAPRQTPYSVTLISAVGYESIFANQLVEGGVDAVIFE